MTSSFLTLAVVLVAVLTGVHQVFLRPKLEVLGVGRLVASVGNKECKAVPGLQACEKIVLHQPSGILFLACSTSASRLHWLPAGNHLNATSLSFSDYVAIYNPKTSSITRLIVKNYKSNRGLSLHGMDVVSSSIKDEVYIYLVNHRAPIGENPQLVGADSSVEVFKTKVGSSQMKHVATFEDPHIVTPNDVVGFSDGKSFYVTNDHGTKVGMARTVTEYFWPNSSVTYCHEKDGCKFVASHMYSANGIARASNDTVYVVNGRHLRIFERQVDNSLFLIDTVTLDRLMDNLSLDADGVVWAAGFPKVYDMFMHVRDPIGHPYSPISALKIYTNTGISSFYGEKYKVEKAFEDDGKVVSGTTTVVHDSQRGKLFFHGLMTHYLTICPDS